LGAKELLNHTALQARVPAGKMPDKRHAGSSAGKAQTR
jgi:hypothetical protein